MLWRNRSGPLCSFFLIFYLYFLFYFISKWWIESFRPWDALEKQFQCCCCCCCFFIILFFLEFFFTILFSVVVRLFSAPKQLETFAFIFSRWFWCDQTLWFALKRGKGQRGWNTSPFPAAFRAFHPSRKINIGYFVRHGIKGERERTTVEGWL